MNQIANYLTLSHTGYSGSLIVERISVEHVLA